MTLRYLRFRTLTGLKNHNGSGWLDAFPVKTSGSLDQTLCNQILICLKASQGIGLAQCSTASGRTVSEKSPEPQEPAVRIHIELDEERKKLAEERKKNEATAIRLS